MPARQPITSNAEDPLPWQPHLLGTNPETFQGPGCGSRAFAALCVCGIGMGVGVSVCVAAGVTVGVSSWAWGSVEGLLGSRVLNCLPWLQKPLTCSLLWHLAPWLWSLGSSRDLCPDILGEGKSSRGCLRTLQHLPPPHQHLSI